MKKLKLLGKYILVLLVCPKQCAEIVNTAETAEEMDGRVMGVMNILVACEESQAVTIELRKTRTQRF